MLKNIIFVSCVISTFMVLGLNIIVQNNVQDTIASLNSAATQARQVAMAQEYAMQLSTIAEYEVIRSHELEESLDRLVTEHMKCLGKLQRVDFEFEMTGMYIQQLIDFIKANNLSVPVFGENSNEVNNDSPS